MTQNNIRLKIQVDIMSKTGMSAAQIAAHCGCTERQVTYYRHQLKKKPCPVLDLARIAKLDGRDLSWNDINRRVGRPYARGRGLQVAFETHIEMLDVDAWYLPPIKQDDGWTTRRKKEAGNVFTNAA